MIAPLSRLLFGFRGRVSRFTFWVAAAGVLAGFAVWFVFIESAFGRGPTLLLYPPLFWMLAALSVKRAHDRGRSPLCLLAGLIPILGPMWLLFELGLRVGNPGENHYGRDPLEGGDYLTVA